MEPRDDKMLSLPHTLPEPVDREASADRPSNIGLVEGHAPVECSVLLRSRGRSTIVRRSAGQSATWFGHRVMPLVAGSSAGI